MWIQKSGLAHKTGEIWVFENYMKVWFEKNKKQDDFGIDFAQSLLLILYFSSGSHSFKAVYMWPGLCKREMILLFSGNNF